MIRESISKLMQKENLAREEAEGVMNEIMEGVATHAQMASYLTALRLKGETVDEIAGSARVMRDKAIAVRPQRTDLVDIVGTGGDGAKTFNISTTAMFVVAGAGLGVAKHGNRAVSSASGSADVLEALGVNIDLTAEQMAACVDEIGAGFLFAQKLHPAMRNVGPVRSELGIRTVFNILGPLTNPARTKAQIVGVYDPKLLHTMASVLQALGVKSAYVFHSGDGMDELTTTSVNKIARFDNGIIHEDELDAQSLGLVRASRDDLRGASPHDNAKISRDILSGADRGPKRDVVVLNAAAALVVAGKERDLKVGIARANESIDSGKALQAVNSLAAKSQGYKNQKA